MDILFYIAAFLALSIMFVMKVLVKDGILSFRDYLVQKIKNKFNKNKFTQLFYYHFPGVAGTISEKFLQKDRIKPLLKFYENISPLSIELGGEVINLPFETNLDPYGNEKHRVDNITFRYSEKFFELDSSIDAYTSFVIKSADKKAKIDKEFYNGDVVRLENLKILDQGIVLDLVPAEYFDSLATNCALDYVPKGRNETLRDYLHGSSKAFDDYSTDKLVNDIGIVCMIETADGQLIIQERSHEVSGRPLTLSSSASGGLLVDDVEKYENSDAVPFKMLSGAMCRETNEELKIKKIDELQFLGLYREMRRGGKPEFYFFGRSELCFSDIEKKCKNARDTFETNKLASLDFRSGEVMGTGSNLELAMKKFDERVLAAYSSIERRANMTLLAGIALSARHIKRLASREHGG